MKSTASWIARIELTGKKKNNISCLFFSFCAALGGTSESDPIFSPTVRKHLRKTRLELLHKEYEVSTWEHCDFPDELQLLNYCMQLDLPALSPGVFNLSKALS